jgi:SAM-dependent methyltransferase
VEGLAKGRPNQVLLAGARDLLERVAAPRVLDLGCGPARNALPLAELGCRVVGVDLSKPMVEAARGRARESAAGGRLAFLLGPMAPLPFAAASFDLVVAHGVWNLATSDAGLRASLSEAARVARPGAELFLFTFSRDSLSQDAQPVGGETLIFDQLAGEPQCFLTEEQVIDELARAGFVRPTDEPLTAYNRPGPTRLRTAGPVIWEGWFVKGET